MSAAVAKGPCPGALIRKRQTWPPIDLMQESRTPPFTAPQPWQPRRWDVARPVLGLARTVDDLAGRT